MARDPNVPDEFDVLTLVVLRRPPDAPDLPEDELDRLQSEHLAHRARLRDRGVIAVNGPFGEQSDETYRGMSVFTCDLAEAARHSEEDPLVVAGRLAYDVMEWWVAAGSLGFPAVDGPVGVRRSMDD
jgi:uncharacterized protein YciI